MMELLKQARYYHLDVTEQVAVLFAGNQGYFDDLPLSQVIEFRDGLVTYLASSFGKLLERLRVEKVAGELERELDHAVADYKREFVARHAVAPVDGAAGEEA